MMLMIGLELEAYSPILLCIVRRFSFVVLAMQPPCFAPIVPFLRLAHRIQKKKAPRRL